MDHSVPLLFGSRDSLMPDTQVVIQVKFAFGLTFHVSIAFTLKRNILFEMEVVFFNDILITDTYIGQSDFPYIFINFPSMQQFVICSFISFTFSLFVPIFFF